MKVLQDRQHVEFFHLQFLRVLGSGLDRSLYAIKGGCNLRFFFNSIRYSEDLDIDVRVVSKSTLQSKVRQILNNAPLQTALRAGGLEIKDLSEPKQTETTQRFKLSLKLLSSRSMPLHTKIEFSRRGMGDKTVFESVSREVSRIHRLPPILLTHYGLEAAFIQKLKALVGRTQTQARDVFDLIHLFKLGAAVSPSEKTISTTLLSQAQSLVTATSFQDFKSQVVAYLDPAFKSAYNSPEDVEPLFIEFVEALEGMKK